MDASRKKQYASFVHEPKGLKKSQSVRKIGSRKDHKILPDGFAQNVIVQEFQIDKGKVEITQLIELYQSAVEYYDSIGDNFNSDLYKTKIMMVFQKPHISKLFLPGKKESPRQERKSSAKRSSPPPKQLKIEKSPTPSPPREKNVASNEQSSEDLSKPK